MCGGFPNNFRLSDWRPASNRKENVDLIKCPLEKGEFIEVDRNQNKLSLHDHMTQKRETTPQG